MLDFLDQEDPGDARTLAESVARFASNTLSGVDRFERRHFKGMADLGLSAIGIDEAHGGIRLDSLSSCAVLFEIAKVNLGPAIYLSVHQMVSRLVSRYAEENSLGAELHALAEGSALGAFCLTEAQAGSDASALQCKASRSEAGFLLSGEKIYISSAPHADLFLVFARTAADQKKGISCFLVDANSEGITIGPAEEKMGCEASPIASVRFDECLVPANRLLGKEGDGYKIALSGLSGGRISIAACACGIQCAAIDRARTHLKSRKQFGKALAEFQGLQFMLADMYAQCRASILLTREAARSHENDTNTADAASLAKWFASDAAMKVSTDAVQLLGGAGYLVDYQVERLMREAKMLQIVEGSNQIQRVLIAKALLSQ